MEIVYFYDKKMEKDFTKILKSDEFMRIDYFVRECNVLHSERNGCIVYIRASSDEIKSIEQKFKDLGAEKVTGDEERTVISTFKAEEDNAATGMGMIFG